MLGLAIPNTKGFALAPQQSDITGGTMETLFIRSSSMTGRLTKDEIKGFLKEMSQKYGIDYNTFLAVATCESGLNYTAIGDNRTSFGVFQIHLPAHPNVSEEEALDPYFNIEWSAEKFKKDPTIWTCYAIINL